MKTRKTRTSPKSATNGESGINSGSNVTHLDDVRRTRGATHEPTEAAHPSEAKHPRADTGPAKRNRRFNQEKVDRLKAAIATGDYEVDAERVAHKFIEHDRRH